MISRFPVGCLAIINFFCFSSYSTTALINSKHVPVPIEILQNNIFTALRKLGHSEQDSKIITDTLMFAELRSNNQGIIKLISGALKPSTVLASQNSNSLSTVYETKLSARVDGNQRNGMVVVSKCVEIAIDKAKNHGVGLVGCFNFSSPTGAQGMWARDIARKGLIGIVMSQCPEMVAPHGSFEPIFGTNPIAISIPTEPRPLVLDMATSASAWFGLMAANKEGRSIPIDVAYNERGEPTTNPAEALRGALRVFDRSFKGSHIALMVELLAGAWTGAAMEDKEQANNWGSLVIAIDPSMLGPQKDFEEKITQMCTRVKHAKKLFGDNIIYLPGERGDLLESETIKRGVININAQVYESLLQMAGVEKK